MRIPDMSAPTVNKLPRPSIRSMIPKKTRNFVRTLRNILRWPLDRTLFMMYAIHVGRVKELPPSSCPCGAPGSESRAALVFPSFSVFVCRRCGLGRIIPPPTFAVCPAEYHLLNESDPNEELHPHQQFLLDIIKERGPFSNLSVCDVGCSSGRLLLALKRAGVKSLAGVEPSPEGRRLAMERGLKVFESVQKLQGRFDVLVMNHVLEHIPTPVDHLKALRPHLKKSGRLIIAVPNFRSPLAHHAGWIGFQPSQHYWLFTPESLRVVIQRAGFRLSRTWTRSRPLWEFLRIPGDNLVVECFPA